MKTVADIHRIIQEHLSKPSILPCKVSDMTTREYDIYSLGSQDRGFLHFLNTMLNEEETANRHET